MKCTCSSTLSSFDLLEAYKEVAELNKTLTYFKDSKHVDFLGIAGNKSIIRYDGFSTVKLEIIFKAKSPQETDQALYEIVKAATMFFQMSLGEGYYFNAPGSESTGSSATEKDVENKVDDITQWNTEIAKLAKRNIDIGLLKELYSLGPKCLNEILALNSFSDEEFDKYCELYREKEKLFFEQNYEFVDTTRLGKALKAVQNINKEVTEGTE